MKARKAAIATMRKVRDRREALGQWRGCGHPKNGERCAVCAARRPERLTVEAVKAKFTQDRGDPFRRDNDGWKRYRGKGRRGAPGAAVNDEQDLRDAIKHLERGTQALAYARSAEVQALPRIQRRAVMDEAVDRLGLVGRAVSEVVQRNAATGGTTVQPRMSPGARNTTPYRAEPAQDETLDYASPRQAAQLATAAKAGMHVYAPPRDAAGARKVKSGAAEMPKPPDLEPLRSALAARGLGLSDEGAYYWLVVERAVERAS